MPLSIINQTITSAIKEMFDGLEPILKKLRFQEAEFKWTKYSEVTSKWIYSRPTVITIGNHVFAK